MKSSGDVLREMLGNVQPLLIPVEGILLEVKQITIMNLQMYTKIIELILMTIFSFIVKYTKKNPFLIRQNSTNLKLLDMSEVRYFHSFN